MIKVKYVYLQVESLMYMYLRIDLYILSLRKLNLLQIQPVPADII